MHAPKSTMRRNLIANYLGQGWSAVIGLAFIPLYIRYLGMESYGLIGLFAVMQAWLTLLDIGMTPTLGREMARFTAGSHTAQSIRDLLRTLEIVCLALATVICIGVWMASGWLASDWLNVKQLPTTVVADAIAVMAFVLALRFVESIYRSALIGLQAQVLYNTVNALTATLRSVGVIAVLAWMRPTVEAFFLWQALISLFSVVVLATTVHRHLPRSSARPTFSARALADTWRFAGGMAGITLLALLLMQTDKVLVASLLPLAAFGFYALATVVASSLYLLITPVTTAVYPRLVELFSTGDAEALKSAYHRGAQLVTVATAPTALLLAMFGENVVFAWSGDVALARGVGRILSVMAVGTFLNGLMYMPYQLQLAHGWTGLAVRTNLLAVLVVVPTLLLVVPRFGAIGASWVWVGLNLGYFLVHVQLMHRRILQSEAARWYVSDVAAPLAAAIVVVLLASLLAPHPQQDRWHWIAFLACSNVLALVASITAAPLIRSRAVHAAQVLMWRSLDGLKAGHPFRR